MLLLMLPAPCTTLHSAVCILQCIDCAFVTLRTKFSESAFSHAGPSPCNTLHEDIMSYRKLQKTAQNFLI